MKGVKYLAPSELKFVLNSGFYKHLVPPEPKTFIIIITLFAYDC